jgi:hypothetical protein
LWGYKKNYFFLKFDVTFFYTLGIKYKYNKNEENEETVCVDNFAGWF